MNKVIITERGWAGHFICSDRCRFRRNTLLESELERIVISTVGDMCQPPEIAQALKERYPDEEDYKRFANQIGAGRYYETMAFKAIYKEPYWEADVSKELDIPFKWYIDKLDETTDLDANNMHDDIVKYFARQLELGISPRLISEDTE